MASPESDPDAQTVAVVGDGVGALITYGVLVHAGMPPDKIAIYGDNSHPLANLRRYANALDQKRMRSESSGHLAPVDFPGMAWVDAYKHRSPWPLLASLCDHYNPPLDLVLAQAESLRTRLGFDQRKVPVKIAQILRSPSMDKEFVLYDSAGHRVGMFRHVILALGHAGLAWPDVVRSWQSHSSVVHAYNAPTFQVGERAAIIGSGMTAAHLWTRGLKEGSHVLALHRHPIRYQQLNAPRSAFSAAGIDVYRRLNLTERLAFLRQLGHGSIPWRLSWQVQWHRARRKGQFFSIQGEVVALESGEEATDGMLTLRLHTGCLVKVDKLVCATGFDTAANQYPLIEQMANQKSVTTIDGFLEVTDDFTLPMLSQEHSICGVVGVLARWALPIADTFAGIKFAARRLAPLIRR